ncbi:CLASP N terminal [Rhizoctonia solani]|uniref:CLASP N terminal n=1 Tax=Rhizoctonia solani TaxID=456999 RepID=A0A8H7LJJ9_9AGAM|nr:CLASP N terminal [Rhizoctonia solani]
MPPSVPDKIPCHSAKDLRYALDPLRPLQEQLETEENWDKISRAIQTIAALTRGGAAELDAEYIKEIRGFSTLILNSMNSERTRLANIAVDLFTVILPPLGSKFEPFIGVFVPPLIKLLGRTNKVFVSRATTGLHAIISHCPHPRILVELRVMVNDKSAPLRVLVAGAVLLCLTSWDWSIPTFAAKAGDVEIVIRTFGTDSNVDVRKITRQIFDQYRQEFPDRVDSSFLEPLTPVIKRYLDIKAKSSQDKAGPAPRKQAPVPAPQFKAVASAPAPVPAPVPSAQEVPVQIVEEQPRPKMTRVGVGRPGPSRAPVVDSHTQAPSAPTHSRIVSGPERIMTQVTRDHTQDVHATAGPMRTTVAQSSSSAPVVRSVSSSGPSRMRVEQPVAAYPSSAFDIQPSSSAQPPAESGRRFRPVRAPMDPSQMPQRVAVPPPVPKPTVESKKPSGPTRVNLGAGVRNVSGPTVAPPARVASVTVKTDHPLGTNLTAPSLSPNTDEPQTKASSSAPAPTSSSIQVSIPGEPNPSLPSPASAPVPSSAPASRPASTIPADSRPPSVASNRSKAPTTTSTSTESHLSSVKNATTATAPAKPTLTTSKSAPITTKVSALIKRGNPYAPPPFVPKRAPASGGVGAGTVSQMARQREAIAAREKREAEEATKKSKKEAREGKKPASTDGATSTRSRPASSQAGTSRNPPAAPRKRTVSTRAKPPGGPPKVDLKTIEPEMIAAVCAPLPGSPTPLAIRETPLPPSPVENAHSPNHVDAEVMVLDDGVEGDVEMQQVDQEPSNEEPNSIETEGTTSTKQEIVVPAPEPEPERVVIEISDDSSEVDMDEPHHEDELAAHTGAEATEQAVQTPPSRTTPISIIDQTPVPAGTTPPMPPTGFAFHPQLAQLMALPPRPVQEEDDFLVDLSSPPPKERPSEKEGSNRMVLTDRGNTHTYLSQFTQDLMSLSGL